MSVNEFLEKLQYLLSDLPEDEMGEAVDYYRDYLEEAGPEDEQRVLAEFGSPERIAAIIRADLAGNLQDGGEFTETGYQDRRFREPNLQLIKRGAVADDKEDGLTTGLPLAVEESKNEDRTSKKNESSPKSNRTLKALLWILLIVVASPAILGVGGGLVGLISGLVGIFIALVFGLGGTAFALLAMGLVLLLLAAVWILTDPTGGVMILGVGILALGLGLTVLALSILFYGKFLPFLARMLANGVGWLIHRKERSREKNY